MSPAFIKGVKENLPKAEITFDKVHIIKLINEAVNQVRREERRYTSELKGNRYMFLKNEVNLTEKQKEIKEELNLAKLNLKSIRAMQIREAFQLVYKAAKRKPRGYKIKHFNTIAYLLTGKLDFSKINKNCLPT